MSRSRFQFFGNHPAVDFVNTRVGTAGLPVEQLRSFDDLVTWLLDAGLVDAPEARSAHDTWSGTPEAEAALDAARALRALGLDVIERRRHARPIGAGILAALNVVLCRRGAHLELAASGDGFVVRRRFEPRTAEDLLVLVAQQIAELVADADPARLRECESPTCEVRFLDTSRNGRRRWCSMELCGNRSKVAAHRRRLADTE
jgi:predicted RNA-binding Zn ribbon-like protein